MTTNKFEDTYSSVKVAKDHTKDLPIVCELLRGAPAPMTCKEIGVAMFGDAYVKDGDYWHDSYSRQLTAHLTQMLRHLMRGGFIDRKEIDGEPVEIETQEYIRRDDDGHPQYIRVHDDEGNEYQMPNPKYNPCYGTGGWVTVKKTVTPKIRVYTWVA